MEQTRSERHKAQDYPLQKAETVQKRKRLQDKAVAKNKEYFKETLMKGTELTQLLLSLIW